MRISIAFIVVIFICLAPHISNQAAQIISLIALAGAVVAGQLEYRAYKQMQQALREHMEKTK